MGHPPRLDTPGSFHHVVNRAVGKRPMFESPREIRLFLARLVRGARHHDVEIHAFSVLTTHFHLLVRSHRGEMSETLHDAQSVYVRRFNHVRDRPGGLVQARFRSSRVDSLAYLVNVVRYIDHNPVDAGLVRRAEDYPFGSAAAYLGRHTPPWITTEVVRRIARESSSDGEDLDNGYRRMYGRLPSASEVAALDRALVRGNRPLLRLGPLAAAHPVVQAQLAERAVLADGTGLVAPMIDVESLRQALAAARQADGEWDAGRGTRHRCGWTLLECFLLHAFAGETQVAIAARRNCPSSVVRDAVRDVREMLEVDDTARARLHDVLNRLHPAWRTRAA